MILMSAPIAVDTFFVLSGLLVSFSMLKHLEKTYVCCSWKKLWFLLPFWMRLHFVNFVHRVDFLSNFTEMEKWMFRCCICIVIFDWHHFWVYAFCSRCLCSVFLETVHYGQHLWKIWVHHANDIGGLLCFIHKTMWIPRKWYVRFV